MSGPGGSRIANERPGNGDALSLTFKTLEMLGLSSMLRTWWLGGSWFTECLVPNSQTLHLASGRVEVRALRHGALGELGGGGSGQLLVSLQSS